MCRRFKQETGLSPRAFARGQGASLRAIIMNCHSNPLRKWPMLGALAILLCAAPSAGARGRPVSNRESRHEARLLHKAKRQTWKFSFELAFGESSPYGKKYPNLYKLPYKVNLAITRDVLGHIVPLALAEAGAKRRRLLYGPSGYQQFPVVPSAQLDAEVSPDQIPTMMDVLGYLAQQTEVIASRPLSCGEKAAIQVTQIHGGSLAGPIKTRQFWQSLRKRAPQLLGFMPVRVAGNPGLRVIDTAGNWTVHDISAIVAAVRGAARNCHIAVRTQTLMVRLLSGDNDWKSAPDGAQYLRRFDQRRQSAVKQRLMHRYRPQVEGWIQSAFEKYLHRRLVTYHGANGRSVLTAFNAAQ